MYYHKENQISETERLENELLRIVLAAFTNRWGMSTRILGENGVVVNDRLCFSTDDGDRITVSDYEDAYSNYVSSILQYKGNNYKVVGVAEGASIIPA